MFSDRLEKRFEDLTEGLPQSGINRLDDVSRRLLGITYRDNAVGDGPNSGIDPRPILNLSALDCQTFVELAIACSRAFDKKDFAVEVLAMRYRGTPGDYWSRNHFLLEEWVPHNLSRGLLKEITVDVADPDAISILHRTCDRRAWHLSRGIKLAAAGRKELRESLADRPDRPSALHLKEPFLPFESLIVEEGGKASWNQALEESFSPGLLIAFVSPASVHLGFVFAGPEGWHLRHASGHGNVCNHDLLGRFVYYQRFSEFKGVKLFQIDLMSRLQAVF